MEMYEMNFDPTDNVSSQIMPETIYFRGFSS